MRIYRTKLHVHQDDCLNGGGLEGGGEGGRGSWVVGRTTHDARSCVVRRASCVVRRASCVVRRASCAVRRASCVVRRAPVRRRFLLKELTRKNGR